MDIIVTEARRALEYLHPDNRHFRFTAVWTMALACQLMGDRASASRGYSEALSINHGCGDIFSDILAEIGLGQVQESENQLFLAAASYHHILRLFGDHPQPHASEAHTLCLSVFLKKLTNVDYLIIRAIAAISSEAIANFDFSIRIFLPVII